MQINAEKRVQVSLSFFGDIIAPVEVKTDAIFSVLSLVAVSRMQK